MKGFQRPMMMKNPNKTQKKQKGLKNKAGAFFDGTLNNRNNINVRELAGDTHDTQGGVHLPPNTEKRFKIVDGKVKELLSYPKAYEKFRDPSGPNSYDNGRTNVNLMEAQVPNRADGYDHYIKLYVEGRARLMIKRQPRGIFNGGLSSGVPARAKLGIIRARDLIHDRLTEAEQLPADYFIEKLTVDVFGFSRGAATARQSIHQMLKSTIQPMYKRLRGLGYHDTAKSAVKVCVAGLYDTVLSFWLGQYLHTEWLLDMQAVTEAEHVLHLAAADEHRRDFPVTNIDSAKTKMAKSIFTGRPFGCRGSYNMALDLEKQKDLPEENKEYMRTTAERDRIINRGHPNILEQDRANLIAQGWYGEHEIKVNPILHGAPGCGASHLPNRWRNSWSTAVVFVQPIAISR